MFFKINNSVWTFLNFGSYSNLLIYMFLFFYNLVDVYDFYSWDQVTDIFPETVFPEGWTEGVIKFFTEPSSPFNYALRKFVFEN